MADVSTGTLEEDVFPLHPRRTQAAAASPQNSQTISARLVMTAVATERLLQMIEEGVEDCVIMSTDGRISVRARLSIDSISPMDLFLQDSDIVVDWSRATITHAGNSVRLSRTELRLLSGLLENNGHAVRRAVLIARAWPRKNIHPGESENALAVYVCALRKRLATIGLAKALQTVRGVGYRITL